MSTNGSQLITEKDLSSIRAAPPERVERWVSYRNSVVGPLLLQARSTNNASDWAKLARSMRCNDDGFQNSMYLFGSNTQWPKVLAAVGATPEEIGLASRSAQQLNLLSAKSARWQRLSGSQVSLEMRCEEALEDLKQRLASARQLQAHEPAGLESKHAISAAWAMLSRVSWSNNALYGPLTKRKKWDSVLEKVGATKEEIERIKTCGRSAAGQTYTEDRWCTFRQPLETKIAEARRTNEPRAWASLARGHWESHPDYGVMCGRFGKNHTDWTGVLRECGLSEEERKLVLFHRRSIGQVTFDKTSWEDFKREQMLPLLEAARTTDSVSDWLLLSRGSWEKHSKFSAISCFVGIGSWYDILTQELGVTTDECHKIESACRSIAVQESRGPSAEEKRAIFTKIDQLLAKARESHRDEDWAELSSSRWKSTPGWSTLCREHGQTREDWSGVLLAAGATREEVSEITKSALRLSLRPKTSEVDKVSADLTKAITLAHEINDPAHWAALAGINWMDKAGSRGLARAFGKTSFDWQGVLRHFGLNDAEIERVRIEAQRASSQRSRSCVVWSQRLGSCATTHALPSADSFTVKLNAASVQPTVRIVIDIVRDGTSLPSDAQLYRRLVGARIGRQDWDTLADLYEQVFPKLKSTLSTAAGLSFVAESIGKEGWPKSFPRVIASVGSGIGSLYRASQNSAERIKARHRDLPIIYDIDPCDAMRARSPNPNKIAASAASMDFKPDSLDAVECSSVLAMGSSEAAALIMKASSAVKVGGLLWFKVDGACFSSGFENALHQAGFSLILPSNTRLAVNECCDEGDKERVADALRTAHFIFAVKTRAVENVILNPTELTFTRTATTDEQLEKLKDYVRALRAARDDPTLVSVAQEFLALAATASNEAITQSPRVWLACLWANAKALYPTKVLPQFPSDKRNDSTALKAWVEKLQKLLDEDERILASLKRDDVGNFVSLCHRACTRLSSIVADMR